MNQNFTSNVTGTCKKIGQNLASANATLTDTLDGMTEYGKKYFWATNAELRFPFPLIPDNFGMSGAIFLDAGSLWEPGARATAAITDEGSFIFDSSEVRMSTGFSIIWQSPLGPLRADIAEALLKADFDKTELFRFGASTNF